MITPVFTLAICHKPSPLAACSRASIFPSLFRAKNLGKKEASYQAFFSISTWCEIS